MANLKDIADEEQLYTGTIIRLYGVHRMDVMNRNDIADVDKAQLDFYDLMIVDINVVAPQTFMLLNVTAGNNNKGAVYCLFENVDGRYAIPAILIKDCFKDEEHVLVIR